MSYLSLPFINRVIKIDCPSTGHKVIYSAFFPKIPYLSFATKQRLDRHSCFYGYLSMDHRQVFRAAVGVTTVFSVSRSQVPSASYTLGPSRFISIFTDNASANCLEHTMRMYIMQFFFPLSTGQHFILQRLPFSELTEQSLVP